MNKALSPLMLSGLRWFKANGPVGWFDASAPSLIIRSKLRNVGLIEQLPGPKGAQVFVIKYQVSAAGEKVLNEHSDQSR